MYRKEIDSTARSSHDDLEIQKSVTNLSEARQRIRQRERKRERELHRYIDTKDAYEYTFDIYL